MSVRNISREIQVGLVYVLGIIMYSDSRRMGRGYGDSVIGLTRCLVTKAHTSRNLARLCPNNAY